MYVKAYAKINLFLDVNGVREDGYHLLDMVMLPLELHDTIEIEYFPYLKDTYIINDHVEKEETKYELIKRTVDAFKEKYNLDQNFTITVHKEIPTCAGLGGGSSNAAALIKTLQKIFKIKMTPEEELEFGLKLGADVPFCLQNTPARVQGIGEYITPINLKKQYNVLIIKPKQGLSTQKVFGACKLEELSHKDINPLLKGLEEDNEDLIARSAFNSLESVSRELCPEIIDIENMMKKDGFKTVLMTGSGSCVFALTSNRALAIAKYLKYDRKGYEVILTKTLKQKRK